MGKIKSKNGFFLALAIILFAMMFLGLGFVGILYLSPNRVMLGVVYAKYTDSHTYQYNKDTDISTLEIHSLEINSERSNISILPLSDTSATDTIVVHQVRRFEGFTLARVGSPTYSATFSAGTLRITTTEPFSFATNASTYVNVYVSKDFDLTSIKAVSSYGEVSLSNTSTTSSFNVESVNLQTLRASSIKVGNVSGIEDFYFRTNTGNVEFNKTTFSASSVTFQSVSGTFNLSNKGMTGTLNVTDRFTINADGKNTNVTVNKLIGRAYISGVGGVYSFDSVGTLGDAGSLVATIDNANIYVNNLYGMASIMESTRNCSNNIHIKSITSSESSTFHVGSGSLRIDSVSSPSVSAEATSGRIILASITQDTDVYAYSTTGSISISYLTTDTMHEDTTTTVITESADVSLDNISSALSVDVRQNSPRAKFNVSFNAIARAEDVTNIIKAGARVVNFTWIGLSDALKCKLFTNASTSATTLRLSEVNSTDSDYELSTYSTYSLQYRIGYDNIIDSASAGRLFVTSASHINISAD